MLEVTRPPQSAVKTSAAALQMPQASALYAGWREGLTIINLRGAPDDAAFVAAASRVLGLALPVQPCSAASNATHRVIWAGPDEWFIIAPAGQADALSEQLRAALAGIHHAIVDVSSGYTVLQLQGQPVREVLAQGCPLDLHPRAFKLGASAGSHYFKASIWLWRTEADGSFEVLVRRSFMSYFWLMLTRCTKECSLEDLS